MIIFCRVYQSFALGQKKCFFSVINYLNYSEKNRNGFLISYLCSIVFFLLSALNLGTSVHAINPPFQESIPDTKAPAVLKHIMRSPVVRCWSATFNRFNVS